MDETLPFADALIGIAQVAIVFAGFAGISVVLSRRLPEHWTYTDAVRMACMIESSLLAAFFALLPFAFVAFGLGIATTLSISGLLLAVAILVHMMGSGIRMRRAYRQDPEDRLPFLFRISTLAVGAAVLLGLILNSLDIMFHQSFGPYLAGLLFNLAWAGFIFMRSLTAIRDTARTTRD